MIKNVVTISLMIFIIVVVGVLGAAVLMGSKNNLSIISNSNTNSNNSLNPNSLHPQNPANIARGDDEGSDDGGNVNVNTSPVANPTNNPTSGATSSGANNTAGISALQVAKHNNASDCWVIINNKVYDLTNFISIHSGGPDQIIPYCGKDGTSAFNTKNGRGSHSQNAQNILNNYYVGNFGG